MRLPMHDVRREMPADGDRPATKTSAFGTIDGGEKWGTLKAIDLAAHGKILWHRSPNRDSLAHGK
jgi:hypothetical protein